MNKIIKILAILVLLFPLAGCTNNEEETKTKTEANSKIKTVTKDDLSFHNTSIETDENGSTVITEIENKGSSSRDVQTITLELKDKDGNVIDSYSSYVGQTIEAGDSVSNVSKTSVDLSSVTSIEYMIN